MHSTELHTRLAAETDSVTELARRARAAERNIRDATSSEKNDILLRCAQRIEQSAGHILAANRDDIERAEATKYPRPMINRLLLDNQKIADIAAGLRDIAALPDPVGRVLAQWTRPNGLEISRVSTPLGVIAVIFESRPNVAIDASALCLKSGNVPILRSGSAALKSVRALVTCLKDAIADVGLDPNIVQFVDSRDRAAVGEILKGAGGNIDVVVPRGGRSLVGRIEAEARIPVFSHLEGNCHVYIHSDANAEMASDIVLNAKLRSVSICGAAEKLLIDRQRPELATRVIDELTSADCIVEGDEEFCRFDDRVRLASGESWYHEYLDKRIACRFVDDLDAAISHIEHYGSSHTDCIVTDDTTAASEFLHSVTSAIVMHNASTQFADGGQFGMGAEIGIATGKMHARGPIGLEQLTSFNYRVQGNGQTRP